MAEFSWNKSYDEIRAILKKRFDKQYSDVDVTFDPDVAIGFGKTVGMSVFIGDGGLKSGVDPRFDLIRSLYHSKNLILSVVANMLQNAGLMILLVMVAVCIMVLVKEKLLSAVVTFLSHFFIRDIIVIFVRSMLRDMVFTTLINFWYKIRHCMMEI